jgi:hypothetical protein
LAGRGSWGNFRLGGLISWYVSVQDTGDTEQDNANKDVPTKKREGMETLDIIGAHLQLRDLFLPLRWEFAPGSGVYQ